MPRGYARFRRGYGRVRRTRSRFGIRRPYATRTRSRILRRRTL